MCELNILVFFSIASLYDSKCKKLKWEFTPDRIPKISFISGRFHHRQIAIFNIRTANAQSMAIIEHELARAGVKIIFIFLCLCRANLIFMKS